MPSFQSDFVFQHCHGKKWILYSDEELTTLNKAFRRNQKSVTLQSNEKKKIVVNFEDMTQKNQVSNVTQKVRSLIFADGNFQAWMFEDGENNFSCFRPSQIFFLEIAYQENLNKIKFHETNRGESNDFTIDIKNKNIIDEENNESWSVIREKVKLNHTPEIDDIEHQNKRLLDESRESALRACRFRIYDSQIFSAEAHDFSKNGIESKLFLGSEDLNNLEFKTNTRVSVHKDCPEAEDYKVYSAGKLYYSVALCHTSISSNTNKHFFMQILVDKDKKYFLYESCGRIGNKATIAVNKFGKKVNEAVADFEKKFYEKTKNEWKDIKTFRKFDGKYDLLQVDMSSEMMQQSTKAKSHLSEAVEELLSLITSREKMNQIMEELKYDLQSVPLGKLAMSQIKEGYSALNKIAKKISDDAKGKDLVVACDEFYTKIPHNFGRKKVPVIQTLEQVEEKLRMLEALLNINIAVDIFNEIPSALKHPLDQCYDYLQCDIKALTEEHQEFKLVNKYFTETHGPTHKVKMNIERVYSCHKNQLSFVETGKTYLLWHGSRLTNWAGILKGGLQIAPTEAPSTGAMFGKGLYFADASSKSANYCYPTKTLDRGLLLLCEVNIGKTLKLFHSAENMPENLPPSYDSITGVGRIVPKNFEYIKSISSEFRVPNGPLEEKPNVFTSLDYNEYVVYNPEQVRMKYLVLVKFDMN